MKIKFDRRWSTDIAFEVEIGDEWKTKSIRAQRGEGIRQALKSGSDLSGSDLSGSDLSGGDLSGSDLSGSDLSGSDLSGSNLRDSDLSDSNLRGSNLRDSDLHGSNLRGSDLRDSDLRGSNLRDSDLSDSDLRGSDLSGTNLRGVPAIPNIHQAVYAAASQPDCLDMGMWHKCKTTHCRAGWVVTLAGDAGAALEWAMGTPAAAAVIYLKSDPKLEKMPNFYASDELALADMKARAEKEAANA